jgi:hypothetical protein
MITVPTAQELNAMSSEERKAALAGGVGQMFSEMANRHVTWIWWTRETSEPTDILDHGTAFILDRGKGPMLVTAAHVYRQYLAHQRQYGALYCQVGNTRVRDLSGLLIGCGNLHIPLGERAPGPDIATFRMNPAAVGRVRKTPIIAMGDWAPPPVPNQNVMFAGYPGQERIFIGPSEINFGFHTGMTGARTITDRQITMLIERKYLVDWTGHGVPPPGYGLGGISGAPLLVPEFGPAGWYFRLGGVISESPGPRPPEDVIFEMVAADRAEFIHADGTLANVF